ncbi:MAG: hypothetical protein ACR5LA_13600 [Wolbachia sp.]
MWKSIKNFFKWIADHTGISWIARKVSSGWKWLFGSKANATQQNTSQQGKYPNDKEQTLPKTLDNEAKPDQPILVRKPQDNSIIIPELSEEEQVDGKTPVAD